MENPKKGDRFIKLCKNKTYVVGKILLNGDWAVLREENGDHQILTSQGSLRACRNWKKIEEDNFSMHGLIAISQ
jgi:hypothetical protein